MCSSFVRRSSTFRASFLASDLIPPCACRGCDRRRSSTYALWRRSASSVTPSTAVADRRRATSTETENKRRPKGAMSSANRHPRQEEVLLRLPCCDNFLWYMTQMDVKLDCDYDANPKRCLRHWECMPRPKRPGGLQCPRADTLKKNTQQRESRHATPRRRATPPQGYPRRGGSCRPR